MGREFVGAGWSFPLRTDATGGIGLSRDQQRIEESIRLILATSPGERPMRPDFGCSVHDYVFAPLDSSTAGDIARVVRIALDRWEPRIDVEDIRVDFVDAAAGILHIDIRYTISGTNDPRNLVFPFYVIPSHESSDQP